MTHFRTRHLKCVVMTQCVITTRQKCVMRRENELRQCHFLWQKVSKVFLVGNILDDCNFCGLDLLW